jgi:hypothetical protein
MFHNTELNFSGNFFIQKLRYDDSFYYDWCAHNGKWDYMNKKEIQLNLISMVTC